MSMKMIWIPLCFQFAQQMWLYRLLVPYIQDPLFIWQLSFFFFDVMVWEKMAATGFGL